MSGIFGPAYAAVYDALYGEKDYAGETDLIARLFALHADGPVASVLDLGCGTGGHALPLAARGLRVTGVDRSPAMLARARVKAAEITSAAVAPPEFIEADVRTLRLGRVFDAAIMMFAVLGYQQDDEALLATLAAVRRHLPPSGLFLFDIWYGPAVLAQRPGDRVRMISQADGRILRTTRSDLDIRAQICRVDFHVLRLAGDRIVGEDRETHAMRFFFDRELGLALAACGFRLEALRAFPDVGREPDETTWTVIGVARALP
ncbi:SAM-dependent methyltransferase [Azospirillum lipoferum]|uniref:Class I SAM-dependent methyltransferase n=1 Tax=Azospirillum lipoferum TaxID=193 RepID=A0A5A9FXY4_AZOLI|nr:MULTISPECIES: class I SAM-dependent methyltransferase [Azospirillum]KAA0587183.1 class I SAM-dependent methyltransferase [Azospirillum lipoferum]MCP1615110.1 SAM-dependent methyltransferase [Azospirillum lipoferum]MDW5533007.1 class I SAM-dependent methyltransferase [Azospirillum sp. NL1]